MIESTFHHPSDNAGYPPQYGGMGQQQQSSSNNNNNNIVVVTAAAPQYAPGPSVIQTEEPYWFVCLYRLVDRAHSSQRADLVDCMRVPFVSVNSNTPDLPLHRPLVHRLLPSR